MAEPCVFVVDDDEAVRDGLYELFSAEGIPVRVFASAEDFVDAGLTRHPGCVILDIQMPGMTGIELQSELIRQGASIPIIAITGQGDVPKAVAMLKGGAIDFIEKPFDPAALLQAVGEALDREGQARRLSAEQEETEARLATLSPREHQVLDLVVAGHSNKAIGAKLGISVRTVENHRAKLMDKMDCSNVSSLITTILQLKNPPAKSPPSSV
jgi:FixJ family two-component response regulator